MRNDKNSRNNINPGQNTNSETTTADDAPPSSTASMSASALVDTAEDVGARREEVEATKAIYGEGECTCTCTGAGLKYGRGVLQETCEGACTQLRVAGLPGGVALVMFVNASQAYPSTCPPAFELSGWPSNIACERDHVIEELLSLYEPGESVVFQWIEHLRQVLDDNNVPTTSEDQPGSYVSSPAQPDLSSEISADVEGLEIYDIKNKNTTPSTHDEPMWAWSSIYHSERTTVMKSVFQGHAAVVHSANDVQEVMRVLLEDNRVAKATHNMMAYRIRQRSDTKNNTNNNNDNNNKGIVKSDCVDDNKDARWLCDNDEDGEGGAGTKIAHLLELVKAEDVVVVVSRWYGGVKLGPQRFKVFNNVAREAILALDEEIHAVPN